MLSDYYSVGVKIFVKSVRLAPVPVHLIAPNDDLLPSPVVEKIAHAAFAVHVSLN